MSAQGAALTSRLPFAAAIVLTTVIGGDRVHACTCKPTGPPCQAVWQTTDVFVGRVIEFPPEPDRAVDQGTVPRYRVRINVSEVFRGTVEIGDVEMVLGGGTCGVGFALGETFLIYAEDWNGELSTSTCTRTRPLSRAAEDLEYLRGALHQPSDLGSLVGRVQEIEDRDGQPSDGLPYNGAVVTAEANDGRYETHTGPDGTYRIPVPAGDYRINVTVPDGLYVSPRYLGGPDVKLVDARGCASVDFAVWADGRIRGRVVDARRDPVAGMTVEAMRYDRRNEPLSSMLYRAVTGEEGTYELSKLPPGRYVIATGFELKASAGSRIVHPGTFDIPAGTRIDLGKSERLLMTDFVLPGSAEVVVVSGTVRDAAGEPVAGVNVYLHHVEGSYPPMTAGPVVTDPDGGFRMVVLAGRYRPAADIRIGSRLRQAALPPLDVSATLAPLEITLP